MPTPRNVAAAASGAALTNKRDGISRQFHYSLKPMALSLFFRPNSSEYAINKSKFVAAGSALTRHVERASAHMM
jgi:hypothetical protein